MSSWLFKLNEDKCKVVSYGKTKNIPINANYYLKQSIPSREFSYNDLIFPKLTLHICNRCNAKVSYTVIFTYIVMAVNVIGGSTMWI